jgi:hypothetical protein
MLKVKKRGKNDVSKYENKSKFFSDETFCKKCPFLTSTQSGDQKNWGKGRTGEKRELGIK